VSQPVAIVTGAARGLGEAIARRLHADGYRVALADIDADGASAVVDELGEGARSFLHDIRELDSWRILLDDVRSSLGEDVRALVNNAARTEVRSFWEIGVEEWDDVLATNLRGTYLGCRAVGAQMRERGSGRIVNVSSVAAPLSSPGEAAYDASKAALSSFSEAMAADLWDTGIGVLIVYPAVVDTELFTIPDNDPLPAGIEAITVDELVDAVFEALASDAIEVYVPSFFKDLALGKAGDVAGFVAGAAEFMRQQ
jgi:3-oxoacyl-[acyl-carrier protein] reductase